MKNHNQTVGKIGEQKAAIYLKNHGYKIEERNYRSKSGEIDIIAKKDEMLIFAEVKTRMQGIYGSPAEAVNFRKRKNITETALCYLMKNCLDCPCRFDIIEVVMKKNVFGYNAAINHIENAFYQDFH